MTYITMLIACAGMNLIIKGNYKAALLCLMIAGILDMFDGKVASTKKNRTADEKSFGIQIDSMCDLICYGVLPALFVYTIDGGHRLAICICAIYQLCALIRLSYFNVDEANRQNETKDERHEYRGLPVTSAALILPLVYLLCLFLNRNLSFWALAVLAAMGISFITPFRIIKPSWGGKIILIIIGLTELVFLIITK